MSISPVSLCLTLSKATHTSSEEFKEQSGPCSESLHKKVGGVRGWGLGLGGSSRGHPVALVACLES